MIRREVDNVFTALGVYQRYLSEKKQKLKRHLQALWKGALFGRSLPRSHHSCFYNFHHNNNNNINNHNEDHLIAKTASDPTSFRMDFLPCGHIRGRFLTQI